MHPELQKSENELYYSMLNEQLLRRQIRQIMGDIVNQLFDNKAPPVTPDKR